VLVCVTLACLLLITPAVLPMHGLLDTHACCTTAFQAAPFFFSPIDSYRCTTPRSCRPFLIPAPELCRGTAPFLVHLHFLHLLHTYSSRRSCGRSTTVYRTNLSQSQQRKGRSLRYFCHQQLPNCICALLLSLHPLFITCLIIYKVRVRLLPALCALKNSSAFFQ
jgi:hypothetical protein